MIEIKDRKEIGDLMSQIDDSIDQDIADRLKVEEGSVASYFAWEFYADVIFEDNQFKARVKRYRDVVGWYSANTPEELMQRISNVYGED